jgi:predicted membrane metal-binding protein
MSRAVFAVLMIFYLLGVFAFHAPGTIHILPFVAAAVLVLDYLIVKRVPKN